MIKNEPIPRFEMIKDEPITIEVVDQLPDECRAHGANMTR